MLLLLTMIVMIYQDIESFSTQIHPTLLDLP